tara:strand:+ start:397 stop:585 length:189 start_codon:yes stop_codon:yes gene_type:complete
MDHRTVASAHSAIERVQANLTTAEAISNHRFDELLSRVKRLEAIMIGTAGATILLLISLHVS